MSDKHLRELERSHHTGNPEATELLIRYLERAGDQEALCALGHHDVDASRPRFEREPRSDDPCNLTTCGVPTAWCGSCRTPVPVYWVRRRPFPWWSDTDDSRGTVRHWLHRSLQTFLPNSPGPAASSGWHLEAVRAYMGLHSTPGAEGTITLMLGDVGARLDL